MPFRITPSARAAASAAALVSVILPCANAHADNEMSLVVITATRTAERASDLLNDITVLDRSAIEASGAATLPELLAAQPGIELVSNGGLGKTASLLIRGAESRHTVVLVDGMRINSATSGDTAIQHIPLDQIERIEIVRGPVSGLYGSEAIGGVVQVFTREGAGRFGAHVQGSVGNRNTADLSAGISGAAAALSYALNVGHLRTDGVSAITNPANYSYHPDHDGYRQNNATGRLAYQLAPGHALAANVFYSDSVSRYDAYGAGSYDARIAQTLQGVGLELRNRFSETWTSTLRLADSRDDMSNFASASSSSAFKTEQKQATWQNDLRTPLGNLIAGAERLEQDIDSTTAYTTTSRHVDSLLFGYLGRFDAHRLQASARRDDNSQFGAKTTGMAYYGYQIAPAWRASIGAGTAYSAPTFNQLYYPAYGNPNLKPETGRNKEAMLVWENNAENGPTRASLTWYDNRVSDLIQSVQVAPYVYEAANVQKARLTGVTLTAEGQFDGWRPRVTYDWLDATDDATGLRLPRRARQHATLGLSKDFGAVTANTEIVASGTRYDNAANTKRLAGYAIVNAGVDYRLAATTTLFARAVNLFDKKYELAADYASTRFSILVGLRHRLD